MGRAVDLHFWSLTASADVRTRFVAFLSADETARMDRFVYDKHRDAYLAARGGLRERLGAEMNIDPASLTFQYGPQGKPSLPGGPAFNLSHAGDVACLTIHPDLALGVDVEEFRHFEDGLAQRFFSKTEIDALTSLSDTDREAGFFRCWTRKEAVIKALGGGLSIPLDAFDVTLTAEQNPELTRLDPAYGDAANWAMAHITIGPKMVGAIAAQTGGAPIIAQIKSCPDHLQVAL